jgi:hypothetical protein
MAGGIVSRKHNVRHDRSRSRYKVRLAKRGLSRTPTMTPYDADKLARIARRDGASAAASGPDGS